MVYIILNNMLVPYIWLKQIFNDVRNNRHKAHFQLFLIEIDEMTG